MLSFVSLPYGLLLTDILQALFTTDLATIWDIRTMSLLWESFRLSMSVVVGSLVLASCLLWFLLVQPLRWIQQTIFILLGFNFLLSPVILLIGWRMIPGFMACSPFFQAVLVLTWKFGSFVTLMLVMGMYRIEQAGIETGCMAAKWVGIIRFLILPQLLPVMLVAAVMVFFLVFIDAELPGLVGYRVYAEEFLSRIILEDEVGMIIWIALPQLLGLCVVIAVLGLFWPKLTIKTRSHQGWHIDILRRLPARYAVLLMFVITMMLLGPILMLPVVAGGAFSDQVLTQNSQVLWNSALLAGMSAIIALLAALSIIRPIVASGQLHGGWLIFLGIQLFLPGALLAFAMLRLSQWPIFDGLNTEDTLLIMALAVRFFPYAVLLLLAVYWTEKNEICIEARLMDVSWLNTLRFLYLPRIMYSTVLILGLLLSFILSELSVTLLMVAPGTELIVVRLYNLLHYGATESVAVLACMQSLFILFLLIVLYGFLRKWQNL